jgi:hypothetical protein
MINEFLTRKDVAQIFTLCKWRTIQELAKDGKLPVTEWSEQGPLFQRDPETVRAMVRLMRRGLV